MGYTTDEIDVLVWQDYLDLYTYWKISPPVHILAAAWIGYKPTQEIAKEANQDFAWEEIMSMFPVKIVPKGENNE